MHRHVMDGLKATRRVITLGLALTLVAGLFGCSTKTNDTADASGKPLKIGLLMPKTGAYAVMGRDANDAMQLYLDQIGNKIAGRPVQIIFEDDAMNPQTGLQKTRKLLENDKVDILAGTGNSSVAYAIRDVVHASKIPFVVTTSAGNDMTRSRKSPYIFRVGYNSWQWSYPMGKYMVDKGLKDVLIMAPDYAAGKESAEDFKKGLSDAGGKVVDEIYFPLGTSDYSTFLTTVRERKPQAVWAFAGGSDSVNLVKQYEQFGLKGAIPLYGMGGLIDEQTFPGQGDSAIGAVTLYNWTATLDNPANKDFVAKYQAKYNRVPTSFAMAAWDAAQIIHKAVEATMGNTKDTDKLIKAMESVKIQSPRGPFELDANHNVVQNMYVNEARKVNGQLQQVVISTFEKVTDPGK